MDSLYNLEFFGTPAGKVAINSENEIKILGDSDYELFVKISELINQHSPQAWERLGIIYSQSRLNKPLFLRKRVLRFIKCNFSQLDTNKPDIDSDGNFNFEEVPCPLRGECEHEGIICMPKLHSVLTTRELDIVRLIAKGLQTSEIADILNVSKSTVNKHRENAKEKLNLHSTAQLTAYYFTHLIR
ncbi:MAG: response regulator transcription factor [Phocaeicola sp.]